MFIDNSKIRTKRSEHRHTHSKSKFWQINLNHGVNLREACRTSGCQRYPTGVWLGRNGKQDSLVGRMEDLGEHVLNEGVAVLTSLNIAFKPSAVTYLVSRTSFKLGSRSTSALMKRM